MPTHTRIPAEKASSEPMAQIVAGSFPLKLFRTQIPIAMPAGVTKAKALARSNFLRSGTGEAVARESSSSRPDSSAGGKWWWWEWTESWRLEAWPRVAMQLPRAMPSKAWWKMITMERVMKKASPVTTRVKPITAGVRYQSAP